MSEPRPDREEPPEAPPFQQEGVRNYLFVGLAATLVLFLVQFSYGAEIGALLTALLASAGLLLRWGIAPGTVLLLTAFFRVAPQGFLLTRYYGRRELPSFQVQDLILGLALLVYLIAQFRVYSLLGRSLPPGPRTLRAKAPGPVRRPAAHVEESEFGVLFATAFVFVLAGQVLALLLMRADTPFRFPGVWDRITWLLWVVGFGGLILSAALAYIRQRQATPDEARRFLEDVAWEETLREQARVHRWRAWYRRWKDRDRSTG